MVYVRPIKGKKLSEMMEDADPADDEEEFQIVMSADGSPLLVADTTEAVDEWLGDKNFGIVALH